MAVVESSPLAAALPIEGIRWSPSCRVGVISADWSGADVCLPTLGSPATCRGDGLSEAVIGGLWSRSRTWTEESLGSAWSEGILCGVAARLDERRLQSSPTIRSERLGR